MSDGNGGNGSEVDIADIGLWGEPQDIGLGKGGLSVGPSGGEGGRFRAGRRTMFKPPKPELESIESRGRRSRRSLLDVEEPFLQRRTILGG